MPSCLSSGFFNEITGRCDEAKTLGLVVLQLMAKLKSAQNEEKQSERI